MADQLEQAVARTPEVGEWGMRASTALHQTILQGGEPARYVADALHGTWLGHPLHPVLTEITIGAWCVGGVMDAMAEFGGSSKAAWAGDRLAEIGAASAAATALTGLADFSGLPQWAAKPATLHAAINGVSAGLYAASIVERRRGNHSRGRALGWTALAMTAASAWLGGMLVYKHGVGVDHSERFTGPKDWTPVLDERDLPLGRPMRVEVEGAGVLLYREGGRVLAIGSVCSHAGGPLEEGWVRDGCVQCPWHDSVFRLSDGAVVHGPATRPQPSFDARLRDGKVELRLANDPGAGATPAGETVAGAPS